MTRGLKPEKTCPNCKKKIKMSQKFCNYCGSDLGQYEINCPSCGKSIKMNLTICNHCGTDIIQYKIDKFKEVVKVQYNYVIIFSLVTFILMIIASLFPMYSFELSITATETWGGVERTRTLHHEIYVIEGYIVIWPALIIFFIANILLLTKTRKASAVLNIVGNSYLLLIFILIIVLPLPEKVLLIGFYFLIVIWAMNIIVTVFIFKVKEDT